MTARVLELVQRDMPPPPDGLRWCWLSLGSEGRGEMGLLTDQDNGIVFECADADAAERWLEQLGTAGNRLLDAAGIRFCDGGIMAGESAMRHDLNGWKAAIDEWTTDPDDVRILWFSALCDARASCGDHTLLPPLQAAPSETVPGRRQLLRTLAREALLPELPFRRFPGLGLRGNRSDKGPSLNLKRQGTHLITHAARLFCLASGHLTSSGTGERLSWLGESAPDLQVIAKEAAVAFNVLVDMRLSWQVQQAGDEEPLSDSMPLEHFDETRKRLLIGAYQTVEEVRLRIRHQFGIRA